MASLLSALSVIGGMGSDNPEGSVQKLVKRQAASVSAAMALMIDPQTEQWVQRDIPDEVMTGWTQGTQGVASDGVFWYFSSNGSDNPGGTTLQGVHRFEVATGNKAAPFLLEGEFQGLRFALPTLGDKEESLGVPSGRCHFGGIDIQNGEILAAIETKNGVGMLRMDAASGALLGFTTLKGKKGGDPPQPDSPWCAVNPLNGLLYSSSFNRDAAASGAVHAYDLAKELRHVPAADIHIDEFPSRIQGGCFSPDGHLFLSSDEKSGQQRAIHVFSSLSGVRFGALIVTALEESQEMEGLCFLPLTQEGLLWTIHAVLLDAHDFPEDGVFFKHYARVAP